MKHIRLTDLIKESKHVEKFLNDLGKVEIEGWGTRGDNTVVVPKGHSKFDRKVVDRLAKKHKLTVDSEDNNAIKYIDNN